MKLIDFIIIAVLIACLIGAVRLNKSRRKNSSCCGSGCSGNCASCTSACSHHKKK